ncbi:MAG: hypothetical protein J6K55_05600 [Clostridia bacterium]|nr:hypothetical protein [Clostridia bacterium]
MKRTALILTLLLALLLTTACHTDNDPWPVNGNLDTPTATSVATEIPAPTAEPTVTQAPTAMPEPTEVPGGSEEPGING